MARKNGRPAATSEQVLTPVCTHCVGCGQPMWMVYRTRRTITTLQGLCRLTLRVRRCRNRQCPRYHCVYRPEEEGRRALPHGEFGLDVIALVGTLRYAAHQSISEIHQALHDRGVSIAERTVTHLLQRYEELVALHLAEKPRLRERFKEQGQIVLAIDGLPHHPPDGVQTWVTRCSGCCVTVSQEKCSLLAACGVACETELASLLREVQQEWRQALGEERFNSLLEGLRHLAVVLDEPVAVTPPPEGHTPPRKRRTSVREKSGG